MGAGESENGCRLVVHWGSQGAELAGSPEDLMTLADLLEGEDDVVSVHLVGRRAGHVRRESTSNPLLRVSVEPGPILVVEGDRRAVQTLSHAMRGVADQAVEHGFGTVARHAHIEHLGDDDEWRAPDTVPLIITSDWPERGLVVSTAMSGRRFAVRLLPDDMTLTANGWDDVWHACEEHVVPRQNVVVHHPVRDRVRAAWGERPDELEM